MNGKFFLDSNIVLYALDNSALDKQKVSRQLLQYKPILSTQVVSEYVNVCLKKLKYSKQEAFTNAKYLMNLADVCTLGTTTYLSAFDISLKYNFSFWDSLIVASALENNCAILYTEDLQHQQSIENRLQIINPFI